MKEFCSPLLSVFLKKVSRNNVRGLHFRFCGVEVFIQCHCGGSMPPYFRNNFGSEKAVMKDRLVRWLEDIEAIGSMALMRYRREEIRNTLEKRLKKLHEEITEGIVDEGLKEGRTNT